jgi:hypothetical protein
MSEPRGVALMRYQRELVLDERLTRASRPATVCPECGGERAWIAAGGVRRVYACTTFGCSLQYVDSQGVTQ